MERYARNPRLLRWFAPFRVMAISGAFIVPFFIQKGLSQAEIFLLQSIFSVACLLWELPSGYLADRIGAARSIKISAPISAIGFVAYGLSDHFWQFAICELVLAVSSGLISGVDRSLVFASLKAMGRQDDFAREFQRINARGYLGVALGAPVAMWLVPHFGLGATLAVDGLLIAVGYVFVIRLVEPPRAPSRDSLRGAIRALWQNLLLLGKRAEVRWLIILTTALNTATYMGIWLSAPFFLSFGLPLVALAVINAVRNLWMGAWSHTFHVKQHHLGRALWAYMLLALVASVAMAGGSVWFGLLMLGHNTVRALQVGPIVARLNEHIHDNHRSTMNSVVALVERLVYTVVGPIVGLTVDSAGLPTAMVGVGVACSGVSAIALLRLYRLGTFAKKG
jgi:MFS family permease